MDLVLPPMPFSAVAAPTGAAYLIVPAEMRNSASSIEIELPPGVVQVIVTWQGAEPLSVRHHRGDQMEVVHTIPSATSGVQRSTGVLTLASDEPHRIRIAHFSGRGDQWEQETLDRGYVAGIQVMPMGTAADITGGGSMLRVDNSVGTRVFLGDVMIHGDTGRRNTGASMPRNGAEGSFMRLRRTGATVHAITTVKVLPGWTSGDVGFQFPYGFQPPAGLYWPRAYDASLNAHSRSNGEVQLFGSNSSTNQYFRGFYTFETKDDWPSALPGTPG